MEKNDDDDQEKAAQSGGSNGDQNDSIDSGHNNNNNDDSMDDNEKTNLIVNYLPQQMTDDEFENLFKKFGTMKSCKIVRNRSSGYSYGFGFVDFETHEQAVKAIDLLNGHELDNKKIKVAFARPAGQDIKQANLYIKNVPNDWTQEHVKKVFEPYGNIIQVRVLGNNRGVAFVLFDLRKQAEDALEALNGTKVEGCENPFEIKFAADKKVEKGGSGGGKSSNKSGTNNNGNNSGRRERGNRGGRNRDRNRDFKRGGRQNNQGSFFDRQNSRQQRGQGGGSASSSSGGGGGIAGGLSYSPVSYGSGAQYQSNFNNSMNGVGPVRQQSTNRMNRFTPFVPVQQQQPPMTAAPMAPNPAYGFPAQQPQSIIPFTMVPSQQMMAMGQQQPQHPIPMSATPIGPYGAAQMPMGYAPMAQSAMSNIYSVASNNMNNAANMQPQIGQPMSMRTNNLSSHNSNSGSNQSGSYNDDGVTLFVYNIGPDADEDELRTMFGPYGHIVKCNVVRKSPGGETKGFGFVTLKDRDQANAAIAGLNGSMRNGRALQVSLKKSNNSYKSHIN